MQFQFYNLLPRSVIFRKFMGTCHGAASNTKPLEKSTGFVGLTRVISLIAHICRMPHAFILQKLLNSKIIRE